MVNTDVGSELQPPVAGDVHDKSATFQTPIASQGCELHEEDLISVAAFGIVCPAGCTCRGSKAFGLRPNALREGAQGMQQHSKVDALFKVLLGSTQTSLDRASTNALRIGRQARSDLVPVSAPPLLGSAPHPASDREPRERTTC